MKMAASLVSEFNSCSALPSSAVCAVCRRTIASSSAYELVFWSFFQTRLKGRKSSATQQSHHPGSSDHAYHVEADRLGSDGRHGPQSVLWHHTRILLKEPVPICACLNESARRQNAGG